MNENVPWRRCVWGRAEFSLRDESTGRVGSSSSLVWHQSRHHPTISSSQEKGEVGRRLQKRLAEDPTPWHLPHQLRLSVHCGVEWTVSGSFQTWATWHLVLALLGLQYELSVALVLVTRNLVGALSLASVVRTVGYIPCRVI